MAVAWEASPLPLRWLGRVPRFSCLKATSFPVAAQVNLSHSTLTLCARAWLFCLLTEHCQAVARTFSLFKPPMHFVCEASTTMLRLVAREFRLAYPMIPRAAARYVVRVSRPEPHPNEPPTERVYSDLLTPDCWGAPAVPLVLSLMLRDPLCCLPAPLL